MPYPHTSEYEVPVAREIGTTTGQLRVRGMAGGGLTASMRERKTAAVALEGVIEKMFQPWIGLRSSGFISIPLDGQLQLFSARIGPSIHFLPYRSVDFGLFFDGGFATLDLFRDHRTAMAILGSGLTLDAYVTHAVAIHFEGLLQGGIASRDGDARVILMPSLVSGIGFVF
jgi:hypothetical protein